MPATFELQGHRGARGIVPENTLPSFEAAFDAGVTAVESDLHLTRDGTPVLAHDPVVSPRLFRPLAGSWGPEPDKHPRLASLPLHQLDQYAADVNPDPVRFWEQTNAVLPAASAFARGQGRHVYSVPRLIDLFAFAEAYAGDVGRQVGKSDEQRARAGRLRFDLELKRVPFRPEMIGDGFNGEGPGRFERQVVEALRGAGVVSRTTVRSFDHRSVYWLKQLEPGLTTAVLVAGTAPVDPVGLVRKAGADLYCPEVDFLDRTLLRRLQDEGIRVIPWTVNDPEDVARLVDWGVEGLTTDYPNHVADWLRGQGISF